MNEAELARNTQLTEFAVKDLNEDPTLPYEADSFDVITNAGVLPLCTSPAGVARPAMPAAAGWLVCGLRLAVRCAAAGRESSHLPLRARPSQPVPAATSSLLLLWPWPRCMLQ